MIPERIKALTKCCYFGGKINKSIEYKLRNKWNSETKSLWFTEMRLWNHILQQLTFSFLAMIQTSFNQFFFENDWNISFWYTCSCYSICLLPCKLHIKNTVASTKVLWNPQFLTRRCHAFMLERMLRNHLWYRCDLGGQDNAGQ